RACEAPDLPDHGLGDGRHCGRQRANRICRDGRAHAMRMVLGADHRLLLPAAALFGGVFLMVADTVARSLLSPTELPVGVITALCGGPFFIYLLIRHRGAQML